MFRETLISSLAWMLVRLIPTHPPEDLVLGHQKPLMQAFVDDAGRWDAGHDTTSDTCPEFELE